MVFVFVSIPIKKTKKPGTNSQVGCRASTQDIRDLDVKRNACVEFFEKFRKAFEKNSAEPLLSTEELRTKCVTDLISLCDAYAGAVATLAGRLSEFGVSRYYSWSSSLCSNQDAGYDDFRYEVLCVYYNAAAIITNMVQHMVCVKARVAFAPPLEKEGYRLLLKAGGYFALCRSIAESIAGKTIASAGIPMPQDTAVPTLTILETAVLAQAQEIGLARAVEVDPKFAADTTARLCHQLSVFYESTKTRCAAVQSPVKEYESLAALVAVKCDVFKCLCYFYAAACVFEKTPEQGLRLNENGTTAKATVEADLKKVSKKTLKSSYDLKAVLDWCIVVSRRISERIATLNSLVHHVKTPAGTASLPAPLVLAVSEQAKLPVPLPVVEV